MEKDPNLYGNPDKIIHYMDYQANPVKDNSRYVPELVPGLLQPLEINEIIEDDPAVNSLLSNMDLEPIVHEAEECTKDVSKMLSRFA